MTAPVEPTSPRPDRPADVVTGFWLWVVALVLLVAGYVVDAVIAPPEPMAPILRVLSGVFVVVLAVVVATFLMLLRGGYRWARTVLTAGGVAAIVSVGTDLFRVERPPVTALIYAATGIVGAVLIVGGIVLLHLKDATAYFTR
ncbi:hypothetical protein [Mycolicibacterium palauense]|uniref:hypothetical protein n=1 Tax=Mycolicibacterium palauense TaxID=2034511 RepID=UPI000BFEEF84|nr:hypothetical protein [Mycolicibacterium palauense]